MWIATFSAALHRVMVSTDCVTVKVAPWFVLIRVRLDPLLGCCSLEDSYGGFQALSFRLEIVPSEICLGTDRLLCCLIVGIQASGISISLYPC